MSLIGQILILAGRKSREFSTKARDFFFLRQFLTTRYFLIRIILLFIYHLENNANYGATYHRKRRSTYPGSIVSDVSSTFSFIDSEIIGSSSKDISHIFLQNAEFLNEKLHAIETNFNFDDHTSNNFGFSSNNSSNFPSDSNLDCTNNNFSPLHRQTNQFLYPTTTIRYPSNTNSKTASVIPNTISVHAESISAVSVKGNASINSHTSLSLKINSPNGEECIETVLGTNLFYI